MLRVIYLVALCLCSQLVCAVPFVRAQNFYDLSAIDIEGEPVYFSKFHGSVSLVVNVASFCGLTKQNYEELGQLHKKYAPRGLRILAFPCNQFNQQEPKANAEIKRFAEDTYAAPFALFAKTTVNDPECHAGEGYTGCLSDAATCCPRNTGVYRHLKAAFPGKIEWNFAKFLIGRNGVIIKRFAPTVPPLSLQNDIEAALANEGGNFKQGSLSSA
eukprot:jgi/Mesen1/4129/ME000218S03240